MKRVAAIIGALTLMFGLFLAGGVAQATTDNQGPSCQAVGIYSYGGQVGDYLHVYFSAQPCKPLTITASGYRWEGTQSIWPQTNIGHSTYTITRAGDTIIYPIVTACQDDFYIGSDAGPKVLNGPGSPYEPPFVSDQLTGENATYAALAPGACSPIVVTPPPVVTSTTTIAPTTPTDVTSSAPSTTVSTRPTQPTTPPVTSVITPTSTRLSTSVVSTSSKPSTSRPTATISSSTQSSVSRPSSSSSATSPDSSVVAVVTTDLSSPQTLGAVAPLAYTGSGINVSEGLFIGLVVLLLGAGTLFAARKSRTPHDH